MKSRLQALSKASNDDMLHQAILQSMLSEIENNEQLQNKIGEILPFLSDGDRNIRQQALTVLAFYNSQFHIPIVQQTIAEMAAIKLSDSACLNIACGIITANIQYIKDKSQIANIFTTLINSNIRANLYAHRLSAYKLFESIISLDHPQVDGIDEVMNSKAETVIESFKQFCGYEQDPRCLKVVFNFFNKFSDKVIRNCDLNQHQRNELFDIVGAFFPITQKEDLALQLSQTLVANSVFADDLAALVSLKLKNSLQDTRSSVYVALPILLVHDNTSNEQVVSVVSSFISSLNDHFDSDSTSATESVVNSAINAITNYVNINKNCHTLIRQIAISEWVTKIVQSKSATEIRAYSIVTWSLEKVILFAKEGMTPLSATLKKSMKLNDESRIQSILASIVEYLKIQNSSEKVENKNEYLNQFFATAQKALSSENRNLQITGLVLIREYVLHFITSLDQSFIPLILDHLTIQPFATQCLIALASQTQYSDLLTSQFINPLIDSIINKSAFYGINSNSGVVEFASKFTNVPSFSGPLFEAMAKAGNIKDLSRSILPQKILDDSIATILLDALKNVENASSLILAIAIRSNDAVITSQLNNNYKDISSTNNTLIRHKELIFSAAKPSAVPLNYIEAGQISTDKLKLLYSAKFTEYPQNFTPDRLALAIRGTFTNDFEPADIGRLLEFENQFDSALGDSFEKFEIISTRFVYDSEYKAALWDKYHNNLSSKPECYLSLYLLCPPEFFASDMDRAIPLFPLFLKCDIKGSLDLLIFTIINILNASSDMEENVQSAFQGSALIDLFMDHFELIINSILLLLDPATTKDAHIRLDVCRIINLLSVAIPTKKLAPYRSAILRKLKKTLDDPKREVRQVAAQANMSWIKVNEECL